MMQGRPTQCVRPSRVADRERPVRRARRIDDAAGKAVVADARRGRVGEDVERVGERHEDIAGPRFVPLRSADADFHLEPGTADLERGDNQAGAALRRAAAFRALEADPELVKHGSENRRAPSIG